MWDIFQILSYCDYRSVQNLLEHKATLLLLTQWKQSLTKVSVASTTSSEMKNVHSTSYTK